MLFNTTLARSLINTNKAFISAKSSVRLVPHSRSTAATSTQRTSSHTVDKDSPSAKIPADLEPKNAERGPSRAPVYFFVIALPLLVGGYWIARDKTPETPAVKGMMQATAPKTSGAVEAAGLENEQRSSVAVRNPKDKAKWEENKAKERMEKND